MNLTPPDPFADPQPSTRSPVWDSCGVAWADAMVPYAREILENIGWHPQRGAAPRLVRAVAVTAPRAGQGVTTIAAALALAAGDDPLARVALVDFDPAANLLEKFSAQPESDPPSMILAPQMLKTPWRRLSLIQPASARTLQQASPMQKALQELGQHFDLIVFDLSGRTSPHWWRQIVRSADVTLLVQGAGTSGRAVAQTAARLQQAGARQLGVIHNQRNSTTTA